MSDEKTIEELIFEHLQKVLRDQQERPKKELEFRVYYDDAGNVVTYSTEDLPGKYIVITREQYNMARHDAKIKDGKLIYVHLLSSVIKIAKTENGNWRVNKNDLSVIADEDDEDTVAVSYETHMETA